MGRYNRDFGGIFTTGSPQLVFCDVIQAEAQKWIQRHERAKRGTFTCRQNRKDVDWPDIPEDFVEWSPKKRRTQRKYLYNEFHDKFVRDIMC